MGPIAKTYLEEQLRLNQNFWPWFEGVQLPLNSSHLRAVVRNDQ